MSFIPSWISFSSLNSEDWRPIFSILELKKIIYQIIFWVRYLRNRIQIDSAETLLFARSYAQKVMPFSEPWWEDRLYQKDWFIIFSYWIGQKSTQSYVSNYFFTDFSEWKLLESSGKKWKQYNYTTN